MFAVARFGIGDTAGANKDFLKAYELSQCGEFEMPFIELGKEFHLIAAAALKQDECADMEKWIRKISIKANAYAKKSAVVSRVFKGEQNGDCEIQLSKREQEVLKDLSYGLSREEIAANCYLSVNTVKKILQSIYIKLDANNSADAIRIATEKKLLGNTMTRSL